MTRLWIVASTPAGGLTGPLPEGLDERTLSALVGPPGGALEALRKALPGVPVRNLVAASPSAGAPELSDLADAFPDAEVALVAPSDRLHLWLGEVLVDSSTQPPAAGSLVALDWPDRAGAADGMRPQCIGVDLDWWPPWNAGAPKSRYPGGPGAAGSARA